MTREYRVDIIKRVKRHFFGKCPICEHLNRVSATGRVQIDGCIHYRRMVDGQLVFRRRYRCPEWESCAAPECEHYEVHDHYDDCDHGVRAYEELLCPACEEVSA